MTKYTRPTSTTPDKEQRRRMLQEYLAHYEGLARTDVSSLNRKLARDTVEDVLDTIGGCLLAAADEHAKAGPLHDFLVQNPLPPAMAAHLPDEFRTFCLLLNALKQWVAAEQLATDRYLLGGKARDECRSIATKCPVTGVDLAGEDVELHHPVRDGRPPLSLSKAGHDQIEKQDRPEQDATTVLLNRFRKSGSHSWAKIHRGCRDLLGVPVTHPDSVNAKAAARSAAKRAAEAAGSSVQGLMDWLDERGLGGD